MLANDRYHIQAIQDRQSLMRKPDSSDDEAYLEIAKSVTAAFFDQQLKVQFKKSLGDLDKKYPELKKIDL
jgi:hypothetical protein